MYRGTTPTLKFTLPFATSAISALNIAFAQEDVVVFEKSASDCELTENCITLTLSENDTLLLDSNKRYVEIQLRVACGETKLASNIVKTTVDRILKAGCLE